MKYLIIGACAAGLSAAKSIRKQDAFGEITMLTNEEYLPYSRPSISYYLKGAVEEKNMYLEKQRFYKENKIEIVTSAKATDINTDKKTVKAGRKEYSYDKLLVATGSKPFVPPMKNVEGHKNVFTFLDLASVKDIKKYVKSTSKAVVIGAGLIGMKAAEGLSKVCKSVDVVELSERVLPSILDEKSSKTVKAHLEKNNIKFHLGDTVLEAKSANDIVKSVTLKSGEKLECDLLVLAVGVRPETELAEKAGVKVERGIVVAPETMQTSNPDIYAAGDCTVSTDMLDGNRKIIALWFNATRQGEVAGSQMAGGELTMEGSYSVNAIDFFGMRICTCGLINAKGEEYSEKIVTDCDSYKRLVIKDNKLVGFVLINSSENAGVYTSLIANGVDLSSLEGDVENIPSLFMFDKAVRTQKLTGGARI